MKTPSHRSGFLGPAGLAAATVALAVAAALTKDWLQGIAGSLAASCLLTFVATQGTRLRHYLMRRRFHRFFGSSAAANQMPLVYPHFSLSREAAAILDAAGFDCQSVFQKTVPNPNWKHKVDLADAVAVNDIEALLHVSFCFSDVLGSPPKIIPDSAAVLNPTASFLSFGFSSNDLTHLFLENCEHPPFVIRSESDATVRFKEYIDVLLEDGSMQTFRSAQDQQIGVIAKFKPSFETDSEVVWIICGGLGPEATIGAGYYLAHAWRAIYKQVGDAEFLCLVKVPKNAPTLPRCCFLTPKKNVREEKAAYEPATSSLSR